MGVMEHRQTLCPTAPVFRNARRGGRPGLTQCDLPMRGAQQLSAGKSRLELERVIEVGDLDISSAYVGC